MWKVDISPDVLSERILYMHSSRLARCGVRTDSLRGYLTSREISRLKGFSVWMVYTSPDVESERILCMITPLASILCFNLKCSRGLLVDVVAKVTAVFGIRPS